MAFGFFRRRQKMVIIIMAVLMVSFLIGARGLSTVLRKNPSKMILGTSNVGDLTSGDVIEASNDLRILRGYLRFGDPTRAIKVGWSMDLEMLALGTGDDSQRAYALLLKEATAAGYGAHSQEIDSLLEQLGLAAGSPARRGLISQMRARGMGGAGRLARAVGDWMTIHRSFTDAAVDTPPSEPDVRHLYRDLHEKIDLVVAKVKAKDMLDGIAAPTDEAVVAQFDKAKDIAAGHYDQANPFGFGYKQPDRVKILYLFVGRDVISRVTSPSDRAVRDYYIQHKDEFTTPATSQPTSAPAGLPVGPLKFSQVRPKIVKKLKSQAVENRIDSVLDRIESIVNADSGAAASGNPYRRAVAAMTAPATAALRERIDIVEIHNERLDRTMKILAHAAGLQAICYPYNGHGRSKLDPSVRVTLSARNISLADALKQIDRQVKGPELKWITFELFDGVIFPDDDSGLQPIVVGESGMIGRDQPIDNPLLANSYTPAGQPLSQIAFFVDRFAKVNKTPALVKVGEDGSRMNVRGPRAGKLLWRILEASVAHAPDKLDADIRRQIVRDLEIVKAFKLARKRADKLAAAAIDKGLADAAARAGLDTKTTGMFSRQSASSPRRMIALQMALGRIDRSEALYRALSLPPLVIGWSDVPGLPLPSASLRRQLVEDAFSLAPGDVEPAAGPDPYPVKPYAVKAVALPARSEVAVLQRVDYSPVVLSDYLQQGRKQLARALAENNQWQMRARWFALPEIIKRLDYKKHTRS